MSKPWHDNLQLHSMPKTTRLRKHGSLTRAHSTAEVSDISGPAAIIAAYRSNGSSARDRFDSISYRSDVSAIDLDHARIRFTDFLSRAGENFVFECEQIVTVDRDGRISAIEHVDLDGAREALADFIQRTEPGNLPA